MLHSILAPTVLPGPKLIFATLSSVGAGGLEGSEWHMLDVINICLHAETMTFSALTCA